MNDGGPAPPTRPTPGLIVAVVALVAVVVGIISVAFRGSWGALRDAALACHFDRSGATLYPFAVDGLLVAAIVAAVLLRNDRGARLYCLRIIAAYTVASWILNFWHGLGWFTADPITHRVPVPPPYVVVIVASLVIGSIFLGSHLVVYVWRHLWPDMRTHDEATQPYQGATGPGDGETPVAAPPELPASNLDAASLAYRASLAPGLQTLSQKVLSERFRISVREARQVQSDVKAELAAEAAAADAPEPDDEPVQYGPNGQVPL